MLEIGDGQEQVRFASVPRFGGYAWLYIGPFALGLGAVAIAFLPAAAPAAVPTYQADRVN